MNHEKSIRFSKTILSSPTVVEGSRNTEDRRNYAENAYGKCSFASQDTFYF